MAAGLYKAAFSPDGQKVATASADKTVRLWEVESGRELGSHAHRAEVRALDFSPDGRWIASGGHDGLVKLWDWESNTIRTLRGHSHVVFTAA